MFVRRDLDEGYGRRHGNANASEIESEELEFVVAVSRRELSELEPDKASKRATSRGMIVHQRSK
jgi:hypothetical protein